LKTEFWLLQEDISENDQKKSSVPTSSLEGLQNSPAESKVR